LRSPVVLSAVAGAAWMCVRLHLAGERIG
jgi:hypothetical protein